MMDLWSDENISDTACKNLNNSFKVIELKIQEIFHITMSKYKLSDKLHCKDV